jgi:hypothetical protein
MRLSTALVVQIIFRIAGWKASSGTHSDTESFIAFPQKRHAWIRRHNLKRLASAFLLR